MSVETKVTYSISEDDGYVVSVLPSVELPGVVSLWTETEVTEGIVIEFNFEVARHVANAILKCADDVENKLETNN